MEALENKKFSLGRYLCVKAAKTLMWMYELTRDCTGLKRKTQETLEVYEENERKVEFVKENLPKVKSYLDIIKEENESLNASLNCCIDDLEYIYKSLLENDIEAALALLREYPFAKNIEMRKKDIWER